jgi:hypothetical protein
LTDDLPAAQASGAADQSLHSLATRYDKRVDRYRALWLIGFTRLCLTT